MLSGAVKLHDIEDAEAFVRACVSRSRIVLSWEERDELVCEGLVILVALSRSFRPQLEGYARAGSFAGYAAKLLPGKMSDAWHKLNEHHVPRTLPDGKRTYQYLEPHHKMERMEEADAGRSWNEFVAARTA